MGGGLGRNTAAASSANAAGSTPSSTSGSSPANRSSSATERGNRRAAPASSSTNRPADLLVRAVLQQPGEQQVAGLEQGEVLGVLHLGVGQQPGGLEVEQRGRDDEELRGLVEVRVVAERREVGDEVVGDAVQRHLGDVELVLADQLQEQVERALEVVAGGR